MQTRCAHGPALDGFIQFAVLSALTCALGRRDSFPRVEVESTILVSIYVAMAMLRSHSVGAQR
jgi:hypothetical protein